MLNSKHRSRVLQFARVLGVLLSVLSLTKTSLAHSATPGHDQYLSVFNPSTRTARQASELGDCTVFPADSDWNRDISKARVGPNSDTYIDSIGRTGHLHPDFGTNPTYGIPYVVVPGTQKPVPIEFTDSADESDPGPYPIPLDAPVEPGDGHVVVVDKDHCKLYELFSASYIDPGWQAASGAIFDLTSNALRPDGWTSADAAGLPIFAGLVRFEEVQAGEIKHALRFTASNTQKGYIHPATHYASSSTDRRRPPMGLRLRLKANFDISGYGPEAQVILKALQTYGMFVADDVTVTVQLPRKDEQGRRISLVTPADVIPITLQALDVGLLHIPIVAHLPTLPCEGNQVGILIAVKAPKHSNLVRLPYAGRPAVALNMSAIRLRILREAGFAATQCEPNCLISSFDVIPGHIEMPQSTPLKTRYERLWSSAQLPQEQASYAALVDKTQQFVGSLTRTTIMEPLMVLTAQRFSAAGLPLAPGEALYIAKTLVYAIEDGLELEKGFSLTEGAWFQRLVALVDDPMLTGDLSGVLDYLYSALVHDAVRLGLSIVQHASRQTLGSPEQHRFYTDTLIDALDSHIGLTLEQAYLPLILAGVVLNAQVKGVKENLWVSLSQLDQAQQQRLQNTGPYDPATFTLLAAFMREAEKFLVQTRVPLPVKVA